MTLYNNVFAAHIFICLRPTETGDPGQPLLPYVSFPRISQHVETTFLRNSLTPEISAFRSSAAFYFKGFKFLF